MESFGSLADGAALLRYIAMKMDEGNMDWTNPDFEIELEPHEIDALPVERDEPDMPSRM
jgi:hypothetical protein